MFSSTNGREAYCEITDAYGNIITTDTVQFLAIDVITIVSQPSDTIYASDRVELKVKAVGYNLRYEWNYMTSKWYQSQKVTASTLSLSGLSGYSVGVIGNCTISNPYGAEVNTGRITVNPQAFGW